MSKPSVLDLDGAVAGDRVLDGLTVDLYYDLILDETRLPPRKKLDGTTFPSVMQDFHHGVNIWKDPKLPATLQHLGISGDSHIKGSPIQDWKQVTDFFRKKKPRVIAEFGVFRGSSSIRMAKILDQLTPEVPELKDSFIVSVDTWILDLQFVWSQKALSSNYFQGPKLAGRELMYFVFLANVMAANMMHRIIPLPSATSNAIQAFLAHGIRLDFCYLDASHANPDVFLDLVGVWRILDSGGVVVCDDLQVDAVKIAVLRFVERYADEITYHFQPGKQFWIYKK
ncbi:MAG: hypothetical protein SGILL_002743 [Bacillariaceae sp.]